MDGGRVLRSVRKESTAKPPNRATTAICYQLNKVPCAPYFRGIRIGLEGRFKSHRVRDAPLVNVGSDLRKNAGRDRVFEMLRP
jgi:hypothetical protein